MVKKPFTITPANRLLTKASGTMSNTRGMLMRWRGGRLGSGNRVMPMGTMAAITNSAPRPGPVLRRRLPVPDGVEVLDDAVARGQLSARGVDKCLRIAWSIADLAGHARPDRADMQAALAMRRGDEYQEVRCG